MNINSIFCNQIRMSQRLTRVQQYLEDGNYQMAIQQFHSKPQNLSDNHALELARAYFANQNYPKSIQISSKFLRSPDPVLFFQANILFLKAKYILQQNSQPFLRQFKQRVNLQKTFSNVHHEMVNQIQYIITKDIGLQRSNMNKRHQNQIEGKKFKDLLRRQEQAGPLEEGMPMFLVSSRWLQKWEAFVQLRQSEVPRNPGSISHFQIIDHRFNTFLDRRSQKRYTNYILFPTRRYELIPKSCWQILKKNYGGIQLKRFNVSVMDKPTQIITEVFLKRILIRNFKDNLKYELQITKKQTWKGVIRKIQQNWASAGYLYEENTNGKIPVSENMILEEIDTDGKTFFFSPEAPQKKELPKRNTIEDCARCHKTQDLKYCQCKAVKYCGMNCLKQDRQRHRKRCELQLSHLKQKSAILDNFKLVEKSFAGKKGLVGLKNLGNTCYMNSGLQCLSNTRQLTEYFMSNKFLQDVNYTNPLGLKGNLACAYAQLVREMWSGSQGYVSPYNLKKMIGKFSGQFSGFGQQDSQELISQLIDGLQQDLNLVKKKQTFETSDKILPDEQSSLQCEINYAKRYKSFIRDLMVGQFKSTVVCGVCERKSICFDPYMLISLPVPAVKQQDLFYISSDLTKKALKLKFQYDNSSTVKQLKQQANSYYAREMPERSSHLMALVDLETMEVIENLKDEDLIHRKVSSKRDAPQFLCYEIPPTPPNHTLYRLEFIFYSERKKVQDKLSYPKFMNVPNGISERDIKKRVAETLFHYVNEKGKQIQSIESIQFGENSILKVKMKSKLKMLFCTSERQTLKLSKGSKITLDKCLKNFESPEVLQGNNEWYCSKCKKFVKATKQMEVYKSNKILVLAFKRFNRIWKVRDFIDFPIEQLNMGNYLLSNKSKKPIIYDLYGVVNHYGSMGGGHYTAYCKNFLNNRWYEFDDSRVSQIDAKSAITQNAYVLFYHLR